MDWAQDQIKKLLDKISFTAEMVKVYKSQLESLIDRDDVARKSEIKKTKLDRLKPTKSPFKEYLSKTLRMIESLSQYWDKADGKTKKKILGCIFKEKFEDFNFEKCNHIFTPEMRGSYSIKSVLPALIPDLSYNDLDIKEGGTASNTFLSMVNGTFEGNVEKTRKQLLEYCKMDTQAMVKILDVLNQV